jgi:hypothetical protein
LVPLFTRPTSISEQKRFNSTVFSWVFKDYFSPNFPLNCLFRFKVYLNLFLIVI